MAAWRGVEVTRSHNDGDLVDQPTMIQQNAKAAVHDTRRHIQYIPSHHTRITIQLTSRYDMIHLLSTIPDHLDGPQSSRARTARSPSPADSWPDAASDEEAIFNLSDEEDVVAYQREKRRKWVDALREERLKGLDKQEAEVQEEEEEDKDARGQADDDPVSTFSVTFKAIAASLTDRMC